LAQNRPPIVHFADFVVRVDEHFRTPEQVVGSLVRRDAEGSFASLEELISDTGLGNRDPHAITSVNGQDAVTIRLLKRRQGNALDTSRAARSIIAD
jgi:HAE1 family hydrophobic/amphiphilic exporter-1